MRPSLLAAALLCAGLAVPAGATPYAGQFDYLSTGSLAITGADGTLWGLRVQATADGVAGSRSERNLYVTLSHCQANYCQVVGDWVRPLTAAEVSISPSPAPGFASPSTGALTTALGGRALKVRLAGDHVGGTSFDGVYPTTTPPGARPELENYAFADGTLELGGLRCTIERDGGLVGQVTGADTVGKDARTPRTPLPAALPAGFLTGKRAPRC